jgi:hypothetical protein
VYCLQIEGAVVVSKEAPHLTQRNETRDGTDVPPHRRYRTPVKE